MLSYATGETLRLRLGPIGGWRAVGVLRLGPVYRAVFRLRPIYGEYTVPLVTGGTVPLRRDGNSSAL